MAVGSTKVPSDARRGSQVKATIVNHTVYFTLTLLHLGSSCHSLRLRKIPQSCEKRSESKLLPALDGVITKKILHLVALVVSGQKFEDIFDTANFHHVSNRRLALLTLLRNWVFFWVIQQRFDRTTYDSQVAATLRNIVILVVRWRSIPRN